MRRAEWEDPTTCLNLLRSRDPFALEADARAADGEMREALLHAAASRHFVPRACHALAQLWAARVTDAAYQPYAATLSAYWQSICAFLPLDPPQASPAAQFYTAQQAEARRAPEALSLYLSASDQHPLAAASVARLGGRARRLAGWLRYRGEENQATVALRCQAMAMDLLNLAYPDEPIEQPLYPPLRTSAELSCTGFTAVRVAVELGASEAALLLTPTNIYVLPLLSPASFQCPQAAAQCRRQRALFDDNPDSIQLYNTQRDRMPWRQWAGLGWPARVLRSASQAPFAHQLGTTDPECTLNQVALARWALTEVTVLSSLFP